MSSKSDELCQEIQKYCSEYDYSEDMKANGFRTFVTIVQKYVEKVADNDDVAVADREKIHSLLQQVQKLLMRSQERGDTEYDRMTDVDREIMSASLILAKPEIPQPLAAEPVDPFWLDDAVKAGLSMIPAMMAKWLGGGDELALNEAKQLDLVQEMKMVPVPRKNDWVIQVSADGSQVTRSDLRTQDMVDCLIVKPKENRHPDCLLFYSHGGGFMYGSASLYAEQVSVLSDRVGVVVVTPNYRKTPVHRYPAGLQDVLDTYCFFTSGSDMVKDLLGFSPQKVVVCGDSAGGNLSTSLTLALDMIRKAGGTVHMPSGMHLIYPYHIPVMIAYPSVLIQNLDPMITANSMAMMIGAYPTTEPLLELGWHVDPKREEMMLLMQSHAKDPLFNNLAWKDWESVKGIPLVSLVCEFDPLLDSGIQFAKRWQGKTRVRVARGQLHGFFMMTEEVKGKDLQVAVDDISDLFEGF